MKLLASFFLLILMGCSHSVHFVHFSDFRPYQPESRGRKVKAETEQFVILSFAFDTDYVGEAYHKLLNECPNGAISGISSQYVTSHGFFSWTNKFVMEGTCFAQN